MTDWRLKGNQANMRSMGWLYRLTPIGVSILLTPLLLFLGIWSAGAGEGNYVLAVLLFPFPILFGFLISPFSACHDYGECFPRDTLVFAIAILQFPVYGLLFSLLQTKARYLAALLVLLHVTFFTVFWSHFRSFGFY